jgi:uncharacterized membrane protein
MKFANLRTTLIRGLTLAVPLAIVGYVLFRVIQIIRKIIAPVVTKLGIHRILGGATVTILAILLLLIVILLLGLLMRVSFIAGIRQKMEDTILRFVPSLNYLKLMEANQLDLKNSQNSWKPVLINAGDKFHAAFIVEESDDLITLFVSKGTSLKEGEILTTFKKNVTTIPATFDLLNKYSKAFGKGFISMAKNPSV